MYKWSRNGTRNPLLLQAFQDITRANEPCVTLATPRKTDCEGDCVKWLIMHHENHNYMQIWKLCFKLLYRITLFFINNWERLILVLRLSVVLFFLWFEPEKVVNMFLKICGLIFQHINSDVTRPSSTTNEVVPQCIVRQENLLDHSLTFL